MADAETRNALEYSFRDGVVWLAFDLPVGAMPGHDLREALWQALARAEAEPELKALVLDGSRGGAGAPGLFETQPSGPNLREICNRIEGFGVPVVAVLAGRVLGPGAELALAAHFRVAASDTVFGLPEVRLGLTPSGGATQRLPRLVGARAALDLMLGGAPHPVSGPDLRDLIDLIAEKDLPEAATGFLDRLLEKGQGPRPVSALRFGFADPGAFQSEVASRREALAGQPELAPREIVAAVEAAMLLPFEAGLALERDAYESCAASEQSRAMRGLVLAEQRAAAAAGSDPQPVPGRIAVLGGGGLAAQIVFAALRAGLSVNWGTRDPEQLLAGVPQLRDAFAQGVARGAISEDQSRDCMARLKVGDSAAMTPDSRLILHAARGQGNVPAPEGVPRAAAFPGSRVTALGLRFAPPVHTARLVEIIAGPDVTGAELAAAQALAAALRKVSVRVRSDGEGVASRLMAAVQRAADALLDAGQDPYAIDWALRDWGWTRPPFLTRDRIGLAEIARGQRAEGARNWSALLCEAGRAGRSSGKGIYDWSDGAPRRDPGLGALLDAARAPREALAPAALLRLLIGAMANEGARMLEAGQIETPAEIDLVAVLALDMPRWRGGPMHLAGSMGLLALRRAMEGFDHPDRAFWTPAPAFAELIKNGRVFDSLNPA